jgi:hypothetical protein
MQNEAKELPARGDQFSRFLGGSPLAVTLKLILMSVLVGIVLAAIASRTGSGISASTPSTASGAISSSAR